MPTTLEDDAINARQTKQINILLSTLVNEQNARDIIQQLPFEINIGIYNLTEDQIRQLTQLLHDIFVNNGASPPLTTLYSHTINTGNAQPVSN